MAPPEEPDDGDPEPQRARPQPERARPRPEPRAEVAPPAAPEASQPPGEEAGSHITRNASLAVGGLLAMGTLVVVLVMLVFGFNAWRLYSAASIATGSRQQLYTTLNKERPVIDQMAGLGGDRIALEDAYLAWLEQRAEPERMWAAQHFLAELDRQSNELLTQEGSAAQREVEHVVRRIRSARKQYDTDAALWDQRASSLFGHALIAVGAGSGPPK